MKAEPKGIGSLFQLFENFLEIWTLYMGIKLDIFDFLKKHPSSSSKVAEHLNCRPEIIQTYCETLQALGYLNKTGDTYALTRWSRRFLWKNSSTYLGFIIESIDTLYYPFISYLNRFQQTKQFPSYSSQHMFNIVNIIAPIANYVVPQLFSEIPLLKEAPYVLDIGCGIGAYLFAIAELNPRMRGLGVDKEQIIIQSAQDLAKSKGFQERIKFIQEDILNFNFSEKFNCILISNVLQAFNRETNTQLLSRISSNLAENGYLIILECLVDESRTSPKYSVLFNMYLRMESLSAQTYTFSDLEDMLQKNFLQIKSHKPIISGLDLIVAQLSL